MHGKRARGKGELRRFMEARTVRAQAEVAAPCQLEGTGMSPIS